MRIFFYQIKYSCLSFSKFCIILISDITSDIISDICHLHKLCSLCRNLYTSYR